MKTFWRVVECVVAAGILLLALGLTLLAVGSKARGAPAPLPARERGEGDGWTKMLGRELTVEWGKDPAILFSARLEADGTGYIVPLRQGERSGHVQAWVARWRRDGDLVVVDEWPCSHQGLMSTPALTYRLRRAGRAAWQTDDGGHAVLVRHRADGE